MRLENRSQPDLLLILSAVKTSSHSRQRYQRRPEKYIASRFSSETVLPYLETRMLLLSQEGHVNGMLGIGFTTVFRNME